MKTSKFAFGKSKYFATHKLLRCSRPDVFCKIICNFTKKVTKKTLLKKHLRWLLMTYVIAEHLVTSYLCKK